MIRVGVVGVGNIGYHHARIYHELASSGEVELLGVADVDLKKARRVAETFGTRAFSSYEELFDADAVSIAVPTEFHRSVALDFIEHGIAVLVEKPIADTPEHGMEIVRRAEEKGVVLMVGHVERFNPGVIKLKELISEDQLGEVVSLSAKRVGPTVAKPPSVGVITDLAAHDIDIMGFLLEERPRSVYATAGSARHRGVEDHAIIVLGFSRSCGVVEANWLTPYKIRKLSVVGTRGVANLDYIKQSLVLCSDKGREEVGVERAEPLRNELEHFLECVRSRKHPLVNGRVGLRALYVCSKALESALTGKVVSLPQPEPEEE